MQVLCGKCALSGHLDQISRKLVTLEHWYPRKSPLKDLQEVREMFGLDCSICLQTAAEKLDGKVDINLERICTPCGKELLRWCFTINLIGVGHPFCRGCIERVPESRKGNDFRCPNCRSVISNGLADFRHFHTIQRGAQAP